MPQHKRGRGIAAVRLECLQSIRISLAFRSYSVWRPQPEPGYPSRCRRCRTREGQAPDRRWTDPRHPVRRSRRRKHSHERTDKDGALPQQDTGFSSLRSDAVDSTTGVVQPTCAVEHASIYSQLGLHSVTVQLSISTYTSTEPRIGTVLQRELPRGVS
jgi:hypothetical protein